MVKTLAALLTVYRVAIYELAGAGLVIAGVEYIGGTGPALIAGGVGFLAKSLEHDLVRRSERQR